MRRSHRVIRLFVPLLALSVVAAACGEADDAEPASVAESPAAQESEPEVAEDPEPAQQEQEAPAAAGEVVGFVTVDGVGYDINQMRRCEPFENDAIDVELELQGIGAAPDGSRIQIDVYVQQIGGMPFDDVAWAGPEGVYGDPDGAEVVATDDRVSGSAELRHSMGDGSIIVVEFDLPIPAAFDVCR